MKAAPPDKSLLHSGDQSLIGELQALKVARAPVVEQNAYPMALGFLAADGTDPASAGKAIISMHARKEGLHLWFTCQRKG